MSWDSLRDNPGCFPFKKHDTAAVDGKVNQTYQIKN